MPSFVASHPLTVGVGQQFAEVDQFWPDMEASSKTCSVSFVCRDVPGAPDVIIGPLDFNVGERFVPVNFTAREFDLRIDGKAGAWELGIPLLSMQGGSLR